MTLFIWYVEQILKFIINYRENKHIITTMSTIILL
jgi:hypothetical protein